MTEAEIIQRLRKVISPYVEDKASLEQVKADTDFINDLNINSANLVDIILDTEDEFDIEIDDDSAEKMLTVKEAVKVIQHQLKDKK